MSDATAHGTGNSLTATCQVHCTWHKQYADCHLSDATALGTSNMLTATCQMQLLLALAIYGLPLVRCHCTWHWQYVDCHTPAHQPWLLAQAPRPLKAPRASTNDSARGALARPKQCCMGPSPHKKKRPLGQLHQPNNLGAVHQAGPQEKAPRAAAPAQKT